MIAADGRPTALAAGSFEIRDYGPAGRLAPEEPIGRCGTRADRFDFQAADMPPPPSFALTLPDRPEIGRCSATALRDRPGLAALVLTHGTGSPEETAFFPLPVWDLPMPLAPARARRHRRLRPGGRAGAAVAGFAPGYATVAQRRIRKEGGVVVMASRAAGHVARHARDDGQGFVPAGRHAPARARIRLQLALAAGWKPPQIADLFDL